MCCDLNVAKRRVKVVDLQGWLRPRASAVKVSRRPPRGMQIDVLMVEPATPSFSDIAEKPFVAKAFTASSADWGVVILDPGSAQLRTSPLVIVRGKEKRVCSRSLFLFPLSGRTARVRHLSLALIEWKWFDRFILFLILLSSVFLATYEYRDPASSWNAFVDGVAEPIFLFCFTLEMVLKIVAWGFFVDKCTYLRDGWNWLDFIVVVSAWVEFVDVVDTGLAFLRLFRILRPLRSLNAVPQMRVIVRTVISSVPRLFNVIGVTVVLFVIFGTIGTTLFGGVFFRGCRATATPALIPDTRQNGAQCWSWPSALICEGYCSATGFQNMESCMVGGHKWITSKCEKDRLCGGAYMCEGSSGFCGGSEEDHVWRLRPRFLGYEDSSSDYVRDVRGCAPGLPPSLTCTSRKGIPWCDGSDPLTYIYPETEFINFDTIASAILLIFQCMTLDGWAYVMFYVQDSYGWWPATIYFLIMTFLTSFFMLNIALAVVNETREETKAEAETLENGSAVVSGVASEGAWGSSGSPTENIGIPVCDETLVLGELNLAEELWWDCMVVRMLNGIASHPIFANVIMLFIAANVAAMCLETFPAILALQGPLNVCEGIFLLVFCIEALVMLGAVGPKAYVMNPTTCFDGIVVMISVIMRLVSLGRKSSSGNGGGSAFTALRTLRLFRVLNKLAGRSLGFRVLLKSMVATGRSLRYWAFLFAFVLYILALMWQTFFANRLHFIDTESFDAVSADQGQPWCNGEKGNQDCIPRANFDTFLLSVVTIFQAMTGEGWSTVMYSCMRSYEAPMRPLIAVLFVFLIFFGQILFMSLFLSMLMAKFDEVKNAVHEAEKRLEVKRKSSIGVRNSRRVRTSTAVPMATATSFENSMMPSMDQSSQHEVPVSKVAAWPKGYAWFVLPKSNRVRSAALIGLDYEVSVFGASVKVFDNFILFCIALSTIGMIYDTPLNDPEDPLTNGVRSSDTLFAYIFICEMLWKLFALGLFMGEGSYLRSGWNWLDGTVVIASVLGLVMPGSGGGFLKTLRISRAFRPLRMISRNPNLKVVVQTMFAAIPQLASLVLVTGFFIVMCALFFLAFLSGQFYTCESPSYLGDKGVLMSSSLPNFVTPLCLGTNETQQSCPHGRPLFSQGVQVEWIDESSMCLDSLQRSYCPFGTQDLTVAWKRASWDTPICIGRCNPDAQAKDSGFWKKRTWLCEPNFQSAAEFPSMCPDAQTPAYLATMSTEEQRGRTLVEQWTRQLVMPCGGTTLDKSGVASTPPEAAAVSCRQAFCPESVKFQKEAQCKSDCEIHPYFCHETCLDNSKREACKACRSECQAQCQCSDFCEPLIKDAALCHEQGGKWTPAVSQNFNNMANSLLTLFEIMSTEGWVDVMNAAVDARGAYMEPRRDSNLWLAPMFVGYIFLSFMFLLNLSVGVIVDQFLELKRAGKNIMLTERQQKWLEAHKKLFSKNLFFTLTHLHLLTPWRKRLHSLISHRYFENGLMAAIVVNTCFLCMKVYPQPTPWWNSFLDIIDGIFAFAFLAECLLKGYALRSNYWKDRWNRFDFVCVVVSVGGLWVSFVPSLGSASDITAIIRIFRIGRIFRFFEGLNKIFMALILSIPKLANVGCILLLLLTLFSILGTSLFSTCKAGLTLDEHTNFKNFISAFITLFRASTGEAWNEIMHDLSRTPQDFRDSGDWCAPDDLFNPEDSATWRILKSRCLIDHPVSCTPLQRAMVPQIFWVLFTSVVAYMMMNLVVAVILEGYMECKPDKDEEVTVVCMKLWRDIDPDLTMSVNFSLALEFIAKVVQEVCRKRGDEALSLRMAEVVKCDIGKIKMRYVKIWDNVLVSKDGQVSFVQCVKQLLSLIFAQVEPTKLPVGSRLEAKDRVMISAGYELQPHLRGTIIQVGLDGDMLVKWDKLGERPFPCKLLQHVVPLGWDGMVTDIADVAGKVDIETLDKLKRLELQRSDLTTTEFQTFQGSVPSTVGTVIAAVKTQRCLRQRLLQMRAEQNDKPDKL